MLELGRAPGHRIEDNHKLISISRQAGSLPRFQETKGIGRNSCGGNFGKTGLGTHHARADSVTSGHHTQDFIVAKSLNMVGAEQRTILKRAHQAAGRGGVRAHKVSKF
jgi:hypothetical protein